MTAARFDYSRGPAGVPTNLCEELQRDQDSEMRGPGSLHIESWPPFSRFPNHNRWGTRSLSPPPFPPPRHPAFPPFRCLPSPPTPAVRWTSRQLKPFLGRRESSALPAPDGILVLISGNPLNLSQNFTG